MSVKSYSYTEKKQLSEHFNASEFRCKCGKNHNFKVDENLVKKLEELFSVLGASKCIITSGFRCSAHDKAVGGSGRGQHTKGTAADTCFYDKDGKPISSKIVSCKAQDLGIPGIANITAAYTHTHLDTRTSGTYKGDETKGFSTVTKDFYSYYGIEKEVKINDSVQEWQKAAILDGYRLPSGADGIWGAECESVANKAICKRYKGDYKNTHLTMIVQKAVGVTSDGKFGTLTEASVKLFQKQNGLTADGIVGLKTWKKILKIE